MKTITYLIVLFLQIFCLTPIHAQGIYEKVTSLEQVNEGGTFVIVRIYDNVSMGNIVRKNKVSVCQGVTINVNENNTDLLFIETVNTDSSPFEVEIIKDTENAGSFYLKTMQGYLFSETSTAIEYSEESNKNNKYKWSIDIGNTDNRFAKISNKSTKRIICYQSSTKDFRAETANSAANIQLFRKIPADNSITLQIGAAKYSTLYYSNKNLVVPNGVEAYTFKYDNNGLQISNTYKYLDVIPKGTAVVLHGQGKYDFLETIASGVTDDNNLLNGTDNKESIPTDDNDSYLYYMLSLNSSSDLNSVGFYWGTEGGGPFENSAHKAYLKIPKSDTSNAKQSFLFRDVETGTTQISRPVIGKITDKHYYTIQGSKISRPVHKGIYIFNGKKLIIK